MHKTELVELKYLSEAGTAMSVWGLIARVNSSASASNLHCVTGVIFFDQGYFGQILEGTRGAVEETWSRIQKDSRHYDIELLGNREIDERRFPQWSMKLFDPQEFAAVFPQFAELIAKIANPATKPLEVLKSLWKYV